MPNNTTRLKSAHKKIINRNTRQKNKNIRLKERKWSEYCENHFELQDGTDNDSGQECKLRIHTAVPYSEQPIM